MSATPAAASGAAHILLVEDDRSLAQWMADYLVEQGYAVSLADRGDEALRLIEQDNPDLVVLDLKLPVLHGFEVCRAMRAFSQRPILMLTASDQEQVEVEGLQLGADDFLAKPVRPRVLLARIQALLRRADPPTFAAGAGRIELDGLRIELRSRTVSVHGETPTLSSQEFDVLCLLAQQAGTAVGRQTLLSAVRGIEYDGLDRSIDMLISRLRRKLGDDPNQPFRIKTVRARGYLLCVDGWRP